MLLDWTPHSKRSRGRLRGLVEKNDREKDKEEKRTSPEQTLLPMRFCEKVGFFSGTDNAIVEGRTHLGGSKGLPPCKILKIAIFK